MIFFKLALKSLSNRRLATILTVVSIALSTSLLLIVERAKNSAEESFTQALSKTDLLVGARGGSLQLVLYSIFNMSNPTHNISYGTYQEISKNTAIAWTIPYSLGDGHRGFRVVGTTKDFFKHYHYRGDQQPSLQSGQVFTGTFDVVIGSEVAQKLGYKLGDKIVVAHGVTRGEAILNHEDRPFHVKGILNPTGTALDRALYISLAGMEALHFDWQSGAQAKETVSSEKIQAADLQPQAITSFFIGAKSRLDTLRLQREINNYSKEPLMAVIPGVALSELWSGLSFVEGLLRFVSWMVIAVGFFAMLIALMTSLNERRREMSIFRAVGAGAKHLFLLLLIESLLLTFSGVLLGFIFSFIFFAILRPWVGQSFGLYLSSGLQMNEVIYMLITLIVGVVAGVIPAMQVQRQSLKDGLSIKT